MFNVWCVWWICHIVNSQLRKSAFASTAKWWLRFETTRSICVALHKGWSAHIREGSYRVLHLTERTGSQAAPQAFQNYSPNPHTITFSPFSEATIVEQGPNTKCMRVRLPHLFNFPTITLRDCLVWCAIATKLSFKWEKSTPRRWKVKKISQSGTVKYFQAYNWD